VVHAVSEDVVVLREDERLLVAAKPAGLLSVPSPNAEGRTLLDVFAARGATVLPVHRLDRDVSGAVLLAKDEPTRARLEVLFRERRVRKLYWALAQGRLRPPQGMFDAPIRDDGAFAAIARDGKPARTKYRTLRNLAGATEVEVDLLTGRYNQIRLHFAFAGHPLVGERKYARGKDATVKFSRPALHARTLAFPHPWTGEEWAVEAPLPPELARLLSSLGG
jgi:23S rRNA pseudouridine1911/1915/1917 synthase